MIERARAGSHSLPRFFSILVVVLGLFSSSPASAVGITGFIQGAWPGSRAGIGFSVGIPLFTEIVTLEGEYSRVGQEGVFPSLTVWSGNILLVSPIELIRLRPYFATGFGVYRQTLASESELSFATTPGFGVFLRLAGPIHGRIDYRVFRLRGAPLQGNQKRFYAGLTLII